MWASKTTRRPIEADQGGSPAVTLPCSMWGGLEVFHVRGNGGLINRAQKEVEQWTAQASPYQPPQIPLVGPGLCSPQMQNDQYSCPGSCSISGLRVMS